MLHKNRKIFNCLCKYRIPKKISTSVRTFSRNFRLLWDSFHENIDFSKTAFSKVATWVIFFNKVSTTVRYLGNRIVCSVIDCVIYRHFRLSGLIQPLVCWHSNPPRVISQQRQSHSHADQMLTRVLFEPASLKCRTLNVCLFLILSLIQ